TASADASFDADGSVISSTIDFGDGTVVSGPSATHTYSKPSIYRVLATVYDGSNSTSAAAVAVNVTDQPPVPLLTLSPSSAIAAITAPVLVQADMSGSSDPDGSVASTSINFGDGTTAAGVTSGGPTVAGPIASHTYNTAGTYVVTAAAVDNLGLAATTTSTITIGGTTVAIKSPSDHAAVTSPAQVTATASSDKTITSMNVLVDDKAAFTGSGASVDTNVTLTPGLTHTITVQATDTNGGVGTA